MCDIDSIKEPKRIPKEEEIKEIVGKINLLKVKEYNSRYNSTNEGLNEDEINSHMEDAYLSYFKMVKLAKGLKKKDFDKFELDGVFDCTYDELEIPEYEDYLKQ